MDFRDSNSVCTSLFEVSPEAVRESTDLSKATGGDFLDNPVDNYLVPLSAYFGL